MAITDAFNCCVCGQSGSSIVKDGQSFHPLCLGQKVANENKGTDGLSQHCFSKGAAGLYSYRDAASAELSRIKRKTVRHMRVQVGNGCNVRQPVLRRVQANKPKHYVCSNPERCSL